MTHPSKQYEEPGDGGDAPCPSTGPPEADVTLLRAAIAAIGEAVLVTSAELELPGPRIQYVNPAFTRMTGYAPEEVLGLTPRILQGPRTDAGVINSLRAALLAGCSFRGETVNYRKDGSEYVVEWLIAPVLESGRITRWVAALRDMTDIRRAEERQRRLAAEVDHRVNNTLAVLQSVAAQTARGTGTTAEFRAAFEERLRALARVHRLLAQRHWTGVSLGDLIVAQVRPHAGSDVRRLHAAGAEVVLRPSAAVPLGMALGELGANAVAHGALSAPGGSVHIHWGVEAGAGGKWLSLSWIETGGPAVTAPPRRRGFGSRLVERGLPQELRAKAKLLFEPAGLRCEISAPIDAVTLRSQIST